jgi:hypothetical protein
MQSINRLRDVQAPLVGKMMQNRVNADSGSAW